MPGNYVAYLKGASGGVDSTYLKDLHVYHRKHVPAGRHVPGLFWAALVNIKVSLVEPMLTLKHAIIKAKFSCPDADVKNGVCGFISVADIKAVIIGKKALAGEAEAFLVKFRDVFNKMFPTIWANAGNRAKMLGYLDTRVVRFVSQPIPACISRINLMLHVHRLCSRSHKHEFDEHGHRWHPVSDV